MPVDSSVLKIGVTVLDQLGEASLEPPSASLKVDLVQSKESFPGRCRGILARPFGILERAELLGTFTIQFISLILVRAS